MIVFAVSSLSNSNDFTGDIWLLNNKSKDVFRHIGARFDDKKYRISLENLKKWINK